MQVDVTHALPMHPIKADQVIRGTLTAVFLPFHPGEYDIEASPWFMLYATNTQPTGQDVQRAKKAGWKGCPPAHLFPYNKGIGLVKVSSVIQFSASLYCWKFTTGARTARPEINWTVPSDSLWELSANLKIAFTGALDQLGPYLDGNGDK